MRLARNVIESETETVEPRAKALPLEMHRQCVAVVANDDRSRVHPARPMQARSEMARIAASFDRICDAMGVTNGQMGRRLGISERRIREYRAGDRPIPSDVWARIGRTLADRFLTQLLSRVRGERHR